MRRRAVDVISYVGDVIGDLHGHLTSQNDDVINYCALCPRLTFTSSFMSYYMVIFVKRTVFFGDDDVISYVGDATDVTER